MAIIDSIRKAATRLWRRIVKCVCCQERNPEPISESFEQETRHTYREEYIHRNPVCIWERPEQGICYYTCREGGVYRNSETISEYSEQETRHTYREGVQRNPERISEWSEQKIHRAMANAFSVISGVKIITEDKALELFEKGEQVTQLSIEDVFYGKVDSSCDENNKKKLFYIPDSEYDPNYDHDFTDYEEDDTNCTRGGYSYKRPAGCYRKAVRVIGKYRNEVWLGQQGWRDESSPGEWAVSYHGTKIQNIPSIVMDGYDNRKSVRQVYGSGIYSTPDFDVAEGYATEFKYKGIHYKCILQNRVNLDKTRAFKTKDGIYFVTRNEDNIRPYGVCLKQIQRESRIWTQ